MNQTYVKTLAIVIAVVTFSLLGWLLYDHIYSRPQKVMPVSGWVSRSSSAGARDPVLPRSKYAASAIKDRRLSGLPYLPGWPVQLPGEVVATPVVADLLGDGHLEVVVPCRAVEDMTLGITEGEPLLFAIRADGSELPRWPVALQEQRPSKPGRGEWTSSPSVFRRYGKDHVALVGGHAGVVIVHGDGTMLDLGGGSDWRACIPLVDLDRDGIPDIAIGKFIANVDGKPVEGWPPARQFRDGYSPCVGDALGDGDLKLFHLFYTTRNTGYCNVSAFDAQGHPLLGWPRQIDDPSWCAPVMGDVLGNGKMQIIACYGSHVFAWNPDGTPLPNTTTEEPLSGILKSGVFAATASPTLADLDGDGKAEIIIFDRQSKSIRAWHGDGVPVVQSSPAAPEGFIATLPTGAASGVSVVSLGDDSKVMDFFVGVYWVRRFPGGKTKITRMCPDEAETAWAQPTVCDLDGDGKADVIFGLTDGRLFVYQTGLAYHAERMQWPTANGNFQHTGAWQKPATAGGQ